MDYILRDRSADQGGCFLCLPADHRGPLRERLVLCADELTLLIMNRFPYNNGHLMAAPRRHVASLSLTSEAERLALTNLVARATEVLDRLMKPDGYNLGVNQGLAAGAGVEDHLHFHVTPRWLGDVNYMTALGETRVVPEHLMATWERLAGHFS
jgi:ATP adenylyltransferase